MCVLQGKAEVVQRALEVQSLPGALPVQMVQPPNGEQPQPQRQLAWHGMHGRDTVLAALCHCYPPLLIKEAIA